MSLFKQMKRVRTARDRVAVHRNALAIPAAALLGRGYRHPLTTVGAAAGAGFVLGTLGVGPLRVPGLMSMLSGGLAEIVAHGTRMLAEMSMGMDDGGNDTDSDDA
jgi:hypothetical protein